MRPVIFIHGFKGSRLVNHGGQVDWLTGSVALGLRTPDLSLSTRYVDGTQPADGRHAQGPLDKVVLLPRVVEEKVYSPFLESLQHTGAPWHAFAYDWRRDNLETTARFADFVDDVRRAHGGASVKIVAHSMGGLITLAAMHQGLMGIHSVLFAGVPFGGGIGFLEDMHAGLPAGFNRRVTSPQVLATFPSVYSFFPLSDAQLLDAEGHPLGLDMFDADTWRKQRLGVYQTAQTPGRDFDHFLGETLSRARRFRELLVQRQSSYPPIHALVGTGRPTLSAIRREKGSASPRWDIRRGFRNDGDGRVRAVHQVPPEGIPHHVHTSRLRHSALLADAQVTAFCTGGDD